MTEGGRKKEREGGRETRWLVDVLVMEGADRWTFLGAKAPL